MTHRPKVRGGRGRVIAIDWSGKKEGAAKTIWLAEVIGGELARLECGRDREEIAEHLIAIAKPGDETVIGLDFGFALPGWFMREQGFETAHALWAHDAEGWLSGCEAPFWGRPGKRKPLDGEQFRLTETRTAAVRGIRPKSVFQIGGAGAVGTGSLRGMPVLRRLHGAGFSIWPFDPSGWPRVIEIYPRSFTGPVHKRVHATRVEYLRTHRPQLDAAMRDLAASSEDAFDAAVSALAMWEHLPELRALAQAADPRMRLEGAIWSPACGMPACQEAGARRVTPAEPPVSILKP